MSNFITRSIDSILESISGPSISKTIEQLEIESLSRVEPNETKDKAQIDAGVSEIDADDHDSVSSPLNSVDHLFITDIEYINSFSLLKSKALRNFIERTYNPNNKSIPNYERYFTFKLDIFLMTWCCVSYCIKSIDQGNVANAYVTGMKEDLNIVGKQYNWLSTYFTIGYAIMIIPSQIIITKVSPRIWIPLLELLWGILTAICGAKSISSATQLYPLRFLIGFFEASSWPGITVIIMNWYGPEEISSRAAGFGAAGIAGDFFVGFMQAAISKTLDGHSGLEGWRWLFIINGIMTVVVALAGFLILPSLPEQGGAVWINQSDLIVSKLRAKRFNKKSDIEFKLSDFWRTIKDYKVWAYVLAFVPWTWANYGNNYFNLWLKALKNEDGTAYYTTSQINMIPSGGYAISFVTMLLWAKLCDLYNHRRFLILEINAMIGVFGCAILAGWPSSRSFKYLGYMLIYQMNCTGPVLNSLLAETFRDDPVLRSVTVGITVSFVYAMDAWYPLYIWPATEAPHYRYGWNLSLAFEVFSIFTIGFYFFVHKRTAIKHLEEEHRQKEINVDQI